MTRVGRKSARISLFNPLSNCSIFGCSSVNPEFRARQGKESSTGVHCCRCTRKNSSATVCNYRFKRIVERTLATLCNKEDLAISRMKGRRDWTDSWAARLSLSSRWTRFKCEFEATIPLNFILISIRRSCAVPYPDSEFFPKKIKLRHGKLILETRPRLSTRVTQFSTEFGNETRSFVARIESRPIRLSIFPLMSPLHPFTRNIRAKM